MNLLDLIESQKENDEKYYFVIFFKKIDIINTSKAMTFRELCSIVGSDLEGCIIEKYHIYKINLAVIYIKDS